MGEAHSYKGLEDKQAKPPRVVEEVQAVELTETDVLQHQTISKFSDSGNSGPKRAAFKFERAPYADELQTQELRSKFNALPSWKRQFIRRIMEHQNIQQAGIEVGISKDIKTLDEQSVIKMDITDTLNQGGLTDDVLMRHLLQCVEAKVIRFDKHMNPVTFVDLGLKRQTLEMIFKLKGYFTDHRGEKPVALTEDLYKQIPLNAD